MVFSWLSDRSNGYIFYCPSRTTKIVESIHVKFYENGDFSKSTKVKETILEVERQTVIVLTVLNSVDDESVEGNTAEPEPVVILNDPIIN